MIEINSKTKKIIEENPLALATVDSKGKPNVIAVAYAKVVSKNQVLVTDNYMKQSKENLEKNNNVCIAVWDKNWTGCKLVGVAEYFASGKWKRFVEGMQENKGMPSKGAILITVSKIFGLE